MCDTNAMVGRDNVGREDVMGKEGQMSQMALVGPCVTDYTLLISHQLNCNPVACP